MRAMRGSLAAGLLTAILLLTPMSAAWALSSDYWWVLPLRGANAEEIFGAAVSGAGDVNGDGYADVIVGAPSKTLAGPAGGRAFLYLGGAGFDTIPALTMDPGPPSFGSAISGAGDVNGDGYADWIVGAPGAGDGLAYLYFGGSAPDAVPDVMLTGPASDSEFGFSVAGAGDVNDDGYDDVIVGAPGYVGLQRTGRAEVFFGGAAPDNSADWVLAGESGSEFGRAVAGAGDVNGDAYDDVIVGAPEHSAGGYRAGGAWVFHGAASPDGVSDLALEGEVPGDRLGSSVAGIGDANHDGYADVIVAVDSSEENGTDAGAAMLVYGGPGAGGIADRELVGERPGDLLGLAAGVGDLNGDAAADVIVSAPGHAESGTAVGRVYLYFGGRPAGAPADIVLITGTDSLGVGTSISGPGDLNGDHHPDLLVASTRNFDGRGRVYVFLSDSLATGVLASLIAAEATPGVVRISWHLSGRGTAQVERRTAESGWQVVGEVIADGVGLAAFEDQSVEPGMRYGYRLVFQASGGGTSAGEVWVDVPRGLELALFGVRPNPAVRDMVVSFAVPDDGRVALDVYDTAGRRVWMDRSSPGPGRHLFAVRTLLAPGVYVVRLAHGGRVLTARAVVLK